jgi:hypothetical protein
VSFGPLFLSFHQAGFRRTRTEYYKGNFYRFETSGEYQIVDRVNKGFITVDPVKREYSVHVMGSVRPATDPSSRIAIEVESRDIGERRHMFGYPARHFITTERRQTEYPDKRPSDTEEITTDGWYLEVPFAVPSHSHVGAVAVLSTPAKGVPEIRITKRGPVPHGLAVWEKTADELSEVTEFSEAPLDQALFEPPSDFRRVVCPFPGEQLSWFDRFLFGWQQFSDWLASL